MKCRKQVKAANNVRRLPRPHMTSEVRNGEGKTGKKKGEKRNKPRKVNGNLHVVERDCTLSSKLKEVLGLENLIGNRRGKNRLYK